MFVIHHTTDVATSLHYRSVEFFTKFGLTPPGLDECLTIVKALLDDELSRRFLWCTDQDKLESVVCDIMNWDDRSVFRHSRSGRMVAPYDLYFSEVLDEFDQSVAEWISNFIPQPTYEIWYLTRFGRDLVLDRGPDYRIVDWERRMQSGEWK